MLLFHDLIKNYFPVRDNYIKSRNKLLVWLNFLHSHGGWFDISDRFNIKEQRCMNYVVDVLKAILKAFNNTKDIISVPSVTNQHIMHSILKCASKPLPSGLFLIDGTHKRTLGMNDKNKRSWKFKFKPAKSFMFLIDRVTNRVCGISLGHPPRQGDITIWKNSFLNKNIDVYFLPRYPILADPGYLGSNKKFVAAMYKRKQRKNSNISKAFFKQHCRARVRVEHFFGRFFRNQFPKLAFWKSTGKQAMILWNLHVLCAIILTNTLSLL